MSMVQSRKPDQTVPSKGPNCTRPGPRKKIEKPTRSENEARDAFVDRFNNPPEHLAKFVGDAVKLHGAFVAVQIDIDEKKVVDVRLMGERLKENGKMESIKTGGVLQWVCNHYLQGPVYTTQSATPNRMYGVNSIKTWFKHWGINTGGRYQTRHFPLLQNKDGSLEYDTQGLEKEVTMTPLPGRQLDNQDLEKHIKCAVEIFDAYVKVTYDVEEFTPATIVLGGFVEEDEGRREIQSETVTKLVKIDGGDPIYAVDSVEPNRMFRVKSLRETFKPHGPSCGYRYQEWNFPRGRTSDGSLTYKNRGIGFNMTPMPGDSSTA